ncbi:hypothetical protein J6590_045414 [Homalodisca vitripennis]|nr:hypothetical protein J6590_045414 [Homalodisca vitripennis]
MAVRQSEATSDEELFRAGLASDETRSLPWTARRPTPDKRWASASGGQAVAVAGQASITLNIVIDIYHKYGIIIVLPTPGCSDVRNGIEYNDRACGAAETVLSLTSGRLPRRADPSDASFVNCQRIKKQPCGMYVIVTHEYDLHAIYGIYMRSILPPTWQPAL